MPLRLHATANATFSGTDLFSSTGLDSCHRRLLTRSPLSPQLVAKSVWVTTLVDMSTFAPPKLIRSAAPLRRCLSLQPAYTHAYTHTPPHVGEVSQSLCMCTLSLPLISSRSQENPQHTRQRRALKVLSER